MQKFHHLSLGFVIASLLSVGSLFAQEDATQTPVPISSIQENHNQNLDEEIARLERELEGLTEENEHLREENERLRNTQTNQTNADLAEETTDSLEEDILYIQGASEEGDFITTENDAEATSEAYHPLQIDPSIGESLPTFNQIVEYELIIAQNIAPYEEAQASELSASLQEVGDRLEAGDDGEETLAIWQEFTVLLIEYSDIIDLHLALYETFLEDVQRPERLYLLENPLADFRNEVSNARIAYNEARLSEAVEHLQNAKHLWQAIEHDDETLIVLLDRHLETALSIEMLSRRYARGTDEQMHQPSPWQASRGENNSMEHQDMAPQFTNLQRAIILWEQATVAAEAGEHDQALALLDEASTHVVVYSQMSFAQIRVVRLNVSRRESLWRIAEEVYGDGFQWTRLWEANKDIISNPDIILPGQELGIPEEGQEINLPAQENSSQESNIEDEVEQISSDELIDTIDGQEGSLEPTDEDLLIEDEIEDEIAELEGEIEDLQEEQDILQERLDEIEDEINELEEEIEDLQE
ncbi:LysM peptidoglycan-binding domain-containing protein [Entomospira culicis]|uniref:LysM peptidoglycan-binding domain-containing protein n=1 Tax=Entomospira culicis TaxID=2719989 RepID=A0A968KUZ2_9SPIO|nr:LysM peptidoglycan-binding domain-containing protein [Entomospira culicis]NIZ19855.1 LysM peptidoglycan-binding domain-containing protein [Entomospira culicis]NIZ70069.1 LysM peptidoglycan-binding domain-containing protein [Entomospira culicis]WDI37173.1 LysM peptidoglycan-binding domain-containing protein [Entomospira culicis]WDI38802.1 LysM peptidoglycan-binding domain-containing protein [Entomospira culicis]